MKTTKKLLSLLLAAALLVTALPMTAGAAAGDHPVYVYAENYELESVSDTFWSWEWFELTLTGADAYRKVETTAYEWKNTVTVTVDHEGGYARLDFKRNMVKNLPTASEFSTKVAAYGAERGEEGSVPARANTQYVWGRTYMYSRAKEYLAKTPAQATLYAKLVTDENGNIYFAEPIWDGDPYCSFRLERELVSEMNLVGEPTGGLDPEKAKAYASDPASPPAMVLDREVTVDDVLYEYIGRVIGCTAEDTGTLNGASVIGKLNSDNQFGLAQTIGGKEKKYAASACSKTLNGKNQRTLKNLSESAYNALFPEKIREQLDRAGSGQGEVGLCKDVKYDNTKGSAIINSDGTISIYPAEGYQVKTITVNGKELEFTTDVSGWTIIGGIRTTDKVVIEFEEVGKVGKCKDVKYDESKGIVNVDDDGKISICPTSPNTVLSITVNGRPVSFTLNYGWVVLEGIRTTDKVVVSFGLPVTAFTDVPAGSYCADAVKWAVENKITSGTSNTTFSPNKGCTRAEAVTFLWRAAGSPEPKGNATFSDVTPGSFYDKAVRWAVERQITDGTGGGKFSPDTRCTRGQIVTFLWRFHSTAQQVPTITFSDVKKGAYYYDAVLWAAKHDITSGIGKNKFGPNDVCTRGQVVTFLYRDPFSFTC